MATSKLTFGVMAALAFPWAGIASPANEDSDLIQTCVPVSERAGRPFGCFIMASQRIGALDHAPFWHVETFPNRAAAEKARTQRGVVLETLDQVWLLTIADAGWRTPGSKHVAEIGPLPTVSGRDYTAQFMVAIFRPGMKSHVHRHSGLEAWYTMSGETCLETPEGSMVGRAGGAPVIVPEGLPMELTATGTEIRRALVLVLHGSTEPATSMTQDWKPKGLCSKQAAHQ